MQVNKFTWFFNIAAHVSADEERAMKEMCLLFPHSASANEAILILNPNYEPL